MAVTIGSNIAALQSQRRLGESTRDLSRSLERLSSGLRINRAGDDAAGLSISESLKVDTRVLRQGVRNLNDGISMLAIADGAIESLSSIVTRLAELAEQAANGVYGSKQRKVLDLEAQALSAEYTRIAQSTSFNGLSILGGSLGSGLRLQAGYGSDGGIVAGVGGAIGTGSFATAITVSATSAIAVESADFNGDGIADLVLNGGSMRIALGNGDGTFRATTAYGSNLDYVAVADFNNDGILDLVGANGNPELGVLLGNGDGSFQIGFTVTTGDTPELLTTADLNGDGNIEIVTTDSNTGETSIHLGRGDGTFATRISYTITGTPSSVLVGDLNGDGIPDLVGVDTSASTGVVRLGRGDGTFGAITSFVTGAGSGGLVLADINSDGELDLISGDSASSSLRILLGNGNGTFRASTSFGAATNAREVRTGDFNGDGILDVVTIGNQAAAFVLLGNGDGSFNAASSFALGTVASGITVKDVTGDGVLDIVTSSSTQFNMLRGAMQDGVSPLVPFDLSTLAGARQALPILKAKIQQLAVQRGRIGAFQSRIDAALSTLQVSSENYATADSRISSADIAEEASYTAKTRILQQSAAAVLAQANLQPSLALRLLKS